MGDVEEVGEGDEDIIPPLEKEKRADAGRFAKGNNVTISNRNNSPGAWGTQKDNGIKIKGSTQREHSISKTI